MRNRQRLPETLQYLYSILLLSFGDSVQLSSFGLRRSEIKLRERDTEGLEGVDGGAVVQVEPIFSHLLLLRVGLHTCKHTYLYVQSLGVQFLVVQHALEHQTSLVNLWDGDEMHDGPQEHNRVEVRLCLGVQEEALSLLSMETAGCE